MKITIVAGARPNFMKIAPIIHRIEKAAGMGHDLTYRLVHTGQHYDTSLSGTFFRELDIPDPHVNLGAGSGSQAEQTASVMIRFEKELIANPADLVIVVGDVTSTMACAITAKKLNMRVAHVEAGIRSYDLSMPEEINRMVTDSITDYFFTTSEYANRNLRRSGVPDDRIFFTGNVMIDTLLANRHKFKKPQLWDQLGLKEKEFIIVTLHRPANVDNGKNLSGLLEAITASAKGLKVIFPVHPRTMKVISSLNPGTLSFPITHTNSHTHTHTSHSHSHTHSHTHTLYLTPPLAYLEFNYLVERALAVITDSGGITEETTVLGVPCMTLRSSTERPETCTVGTNEILGTDPAAIGPAMDKLRAGRWKKGSIPEKWDGRAAERIVEIIVRILDKSKNS